MCLNVKEFFKKIISLSLSLAVVYFVGMPIVAFSAGSSENKAELTATFVNGGVLQGEDYTISYPAQIDIPSDGNGKIEISADFNFFSVEDSLSIYVHDESVQTRGDNDEYFLLKNVADSNQTITMVMDNNYKEYMIGDDGQFTITYKFNDSDEPAKRPNGIYKCTLIMEVSCFIGE